MFTTSFCCSDFQMVSMWQPYNYKSFVKQMQLWSPTRGLGLSSFKRPFRLLLSVHINCPLFSYSKCREFSAFLYRQDWCYSPGQLSHCTYFFIDACVHLHIQQISHTMKLVTFKEFMGKWATVHQFQKQCHFRHFTSWKNACIRTKLHYVSYV